MGVCLSLLKMIFTLVSLTLVAKVISGKNCPHAWVDGSYVDMGCIMMNANYSMTWLEANVYCNTQHNSSLVEFRMPEQLEFVQMELEMLEEHDGPRMWWTSGTDVGREGLWYWSSSLAPVHDFVWASDFQDKGITQNCLYLQNDSEPRYSGYGYDCTNNILFPMCQI